MATVERSIVSVSTAVKALGVAHASPGIRAAVGARPMGIARGNMLSLSQSARHAVLDGAKAAGATWIRTDFTWATIEPVTQGVYDWTAADDLVSYANGQGLRLLPILNSVPTWALPYGYTDCYQSPPNNNDQYAAFVTATVNRFKASIHYWEVWNEPNLCGYFTPTSYTDLLQHASTAIKAADSTATVLLGGMAPAATGGGTYSPPDWLQGLYAAGGGSSYDIAAHHPYFWTDTQTFPYVYAGAWAQIEETTPNIRGIMTANGDSSKALWLTEFGEPTGGGTYAATELEQATLLAQAFIRNDAFTWKTGPLFWYSYDDLGTDSGDYEDWFGLAASDGRQKHAWDTYHHLTAGSPSFLPYERTITSISAALFSRSHVLTNITATVKKVSIPRTITGISGSLMSSSELLGVYVSGVSVPALQAGLTFDQRLDDRASGSFAVFDETGTDYPLQERQQVEIVDNSHASILYRGFVASIAEQAFAPRQASTELLRTVTLEDLRALAEKRLCDRDYINWTAGNIAADLVRQRLAGEQITANFAMRYDQDTASFGQGTLTGTTAANGYLELAKAGSDITSIETTTADFSAGTFDHVYATDNSLQLWTGRAIKMTGTASKSVGILGGNAYCYWTIWQTDSPLTVNAGDKLEFLVWMPSTSAALIGGLDLTFTDGSGLRDTHQPDQYGIDCHPGTTLGGWADDQWFTRSIQMPTSVVGKQLKSCQMVLEGDQEGMYTFYARDIFFRTSSGVNRIVIFDYGQTSLNRSMQKSCAGYYNIAVTNVQYFWERGTRISPALSLTSAALAGPTLMSWSATLPAQPSGGAASETRPAQVTIEASLDNGDTWQICSQNKPIPALIAGQSLTGKSLLVKQTLCVGGPNPELAPILNDVTVTVGSAYNASKSDVSSSYAGSEMTDGTNTLVGYQAAVNTGGGWQRADVSGLKLNGWRKNWRTGEFVNHAKYGTGGSIMGGANGALRLSTAGAGETVIHFEDAGTLSGHVCIECDLYIGTASNVGVLYHTTTWNNTMNTFGYYAFLGPTQIGLGKGSNSGADSWTLFSAASVTLATNQWYHLKVWQSTDNYHHVLVDGVEYLSWQDTSYTSGGVGVRVYASSGAGYGYFDNYGATDNAYLAWGVRDAPAVSLAPATHVGDTRIWWQEDVPAGCTLSVQTSINGGVDYIDCTNGGSIPWLGHGDSLTGISLRVRTRLLTTTASHSPTMLGISWLVTGDFSASGSRVSPALSANPAVTVGSSSVTWDADVPSSGTLGIDSSLNGSSWSALSVSGDPVAGLTEQGDCWWDTFETDSSASYTYDVGRWLWDTANSRLVTQSTNYGDLLLTGVTSSNAEITLISDQCQELYVTLRRIASNNLYYLALFDLSGNTPGSVILHKVTPGGGDVTVTSASIAFTRGTYATIRAYISGGTIEVTFNGSRVISYTDGSPIAGSGSLGLGRGTGTNHINDLGIRPLGQDANGVSVYTRQRLTSTNPVQSPKVKEVVACVRAPEIATGTTIPQTKDWAYKQSVAAALDEIAKASQMSWRFNESFQLVMRPRDGQFAPFVLWQGDGGNIDGITLPRVQRQSPTYCNRFYVTGGVDLATFTESKLGNGYSISWELTYPVEELLSIEMNGQSQALGVRDTDTGRSFYYKQGENVLSYDASLPPPTSDFTITYIARKSYRAIAEDTDQQAIVAALEGSTGIVEASEEQSGITADAADVLASVRLLERARLAVTLSLMTRTTGLAPGQLMTVSIPKHDLVDMQFLLTSVSTQIRQQYDGTLVYWYTIEATTGPSLGSWARTLSLRLQA